jgi:hypothetical protein
MRPALIKAKQDTEKTDLEEERESPPALKQKNPQLWRAFGAPPVGRIANLIGRCMDDLCLWSLRQKSTGKSDGDIAFS